MTSDEFIKQFLPVAKKVEQETGIWYEAQLVQSAVETGWGTRVKGNNYFGIKGKQQLVLTREVHDNPNVKYPEVKSITPFIEDGKQQYEYIVKTWFSSYATPIDSFRAYAEFIKTNPRYTKALQQTTVEGYLQEVARAKYATGLNYEQTLLDVLKSVRKRLNTNE